MVLFERDVNRAQRTRHDREAAFVERQPGPRAPFGNRPGDHHAARRNLDDLGAGADMGTHPGIERQPVGTTARDILGKRGQWLVDLPRRAQRRVEVAKSEPLRTVAHRQQQPPRYTAALQTGRHHDLKRADGIGPALPDMILMRPTDHRIPAVRGQLVSARHVAKRKRHAKCPRNRPVRLGRIDRHEPVIEVTADRGVAVIKHAGPIVPHKLRHRRLDLRPEHLVEKVRPLGEGGDDQPLGDIPLGNIAGHRLAVISSRRQRSPR
jgi:hypothetical protein